VFRTHVVLGATIVDEVLSDEQTAWVRHHHECWDGSGYPDGIAGTVVPDGALVIAVADAWDSMTGEAASPRTKPVEALAKLVDAAGSQFSTHVVDALVELWNRDELERGDGSPGVERSEQAA
jgi:HD-GYP domain-containing protein (c-di-GMP phosphodiesterase class II)